MGKTLTRSGGRTSDWIQCIDINRNLSGCLHEAGMRHIHNAQLVNPILPACMLAQCHCDSGRLSVFTFHMREGPMLV